MDVDRQKKEEFNKKLKGEKLDRQKLERAC